MTELSPTLHSLLKLGFVQTVTQSGMPTVEYEMPFLPLTCCDGMSQYLKEVVFVGGVLNTGRVISQVESEIPPDLETKEAAAAWLFYVLRNSAGEIAPVPEWFLLGEAHQHLVPMVARRLAYEARPFCVLDRDFARILRSRLNPRLEGAQPGELMSFRFDGRLLTVSIGSDELELPATGDAWNGHIELSIKKLMALPKRYLGDDVTISYWDDALCVESTCYEADWIANDEVKNA